MDENLVSRCERSYVLADGRDDTRGFDAECERWLSADVPFAHAYDLVPVTDLCGAHHDHELVRRERSRRRELKQANLAPNASMPAARIHRTATREDPMASPGAVDALLA
jgi:hypothetical protein